MRYKLLQILACIISASTGLFAVVCIYIIITEGQAGLDNAFWGK